MELRRDVKLSDGGCGFLVNKFEVFKRFILGLFNFFVENIFLLRLVFFRDGVLKDVFLKFIVFLVFCFVICWS